MHLKLIDDNGCVCETWYIPSTETSAEELAELVEACLPVYAYEDDYDD